MTEETEMTPKPAVPAPTVPVDASAPVVTEKTSTQTERVTSGPEQPQESTLGNQSVRGTCALVAVSAVGAGFLMLLAAVVLGTLTIDASSMALISAIASPLSMIVAQYFGQQGQKKGNS